MSFSSFGSMIYCILYTITYINSYPIHVSCLLSCCGYMPMLYFSFNFLFSLLSVLYLFISFFVYYTLYFLYIVFVYCSYTIFVYLYSCTVHFLYCFPVILFIWLSLLCTCICCHIFSYDIHILCFSYAFHMLFVYYAFLFYTLYCSYTFHVLSSCTLLLVLVTVYTFIA